MALFFEDARVGMEIPSLVKRPGLVQMVKWAGASENFHPIHYDQQVARAWGVEDVLVHGRLKAAFLAQMLTTWMGPGGFLRKLAVRFLGMDFPDRDLVCRGIVTGKRLQDGEPLVECQVWMENAQGEKTVSGTALVRLPQRQ